MGVSLLWSLTTCGLFALLRGVGTNEDRERTEHFGIERTRTALSYLGGHAAIAHGQKERVCVNTGIVYIPRLSVYVMYVLALCGHCSER